MRPLTDTMPKPLAPVHGKPLIVHHLEKLARAGVRHVVVNLAWLGERIRATLGDGSAWGVSIRYSEEGAAALDVGGGIFRALPWLGQEPFLVVSADVYTDLSFDALSMGGEALGHLVLVASPPEHPSGDFALAGRRVQPTGTSPETLTYAGIGLLRAALFEGCVPGRFPLLPQLQRAMRAGRLEGERFGGSWTNVGTLAQLQALQDEAVALR
jgi:MurNAc alpha-1-phosphate uridylyltransferase